LNRVVWDRTLPVASPEVNQSSKPRAGQKTSEEFQKIFNEKLTGLRFSRHASERLERRQIKLSVEQMSRLEKGVAQAGSKGARESLILLDDLALLVSIHNRTVITAVTRQEMKDSVFTNIDSAVLL